MSSRELAFPFHVSDDRPSNGTVGAAFSFQATADNVIVKIATRHDVRAVPAFS